MVYKLSNINKIKISIFNNNNYILYNKIYYIFFILLDKSIFDNNILFL